MPDAQTASRTPAAPAPAHGPAGEARRPMPRPRAVALDPGSPPARVRRRHWLAMLAFLLLVALPTVLAGAYLYTTAADRYASRLAFSIRSGDTAPSLEILGTVTQLGGSSMLTDGRILYDFIRSQQIVETVRTRLPLEEYWNRRPEAWVFSLGRDQSIEELVDYWNRMVDVSLDPVTGIITIEVRAFTANDAQAIAAAILAASTDLVNRLSETARTDAVRFAALELEAAEARLRVIRARLAQFRDRAQEVDPSENARMAVDLLAGLEQELAGARVRLGILRATLDENAPRIGLLKRRIAALEARIEAERTRLGRGSATDNAQAGALSRIVGEYEELVVDRDFAEQAYSLALAAYQQAEAEARRRHRYLAPHIAPTLAEEAEYPDRPMLLGGLFLLAVAVWSILVLGAWNLRDRG